MRVKLNRKSNKQFRKLPLRYQQKIFKKLKSLPQNPHQGKNLEGEYKSYKSLRSWPYRIIYQVKPNHILIISITHRQSAYKN